MSNLYMTTEEFAKMVIDAMDEQNYFKKGTKHHPQDIAYTFTTVAETIGQALYWAIQREADVEKQKKNAVMKPTNLKKDASTVNMDRYFENIGATD